MNPAEVVMHVMERDRVLQILYLFAECVGQPSKPAHRHSHRQILALNVARGNVAVIRIAADDRLARTHADCGAVALVCVFRGAINLLKLCIINLRGEHIFDSNEIGNMAIRRKLNAIRETAFQILQEMISATGIPLTDEPAGNEFAVRVESHPCPAIAAALRLLLRRAILSFRINERPNLVTLDSFTGKIAKNLVLIFRTGAAKIAKQFHYRGAMYATHASDGAKRIAFDQGCDNRCPFSAIQFVHA